MARAEKARAVVLSSRPLGEADRIVRLFTRELGRVDAVVKGVRKTTSRWGGRLEPFNVCDLMLHPGRSLYTVTQAQLVDVFAQAARRSRGAHGGGDRLRGRRRAHARARARGARVRAPAQHAARARPRHPGPRRRVAARARRAAQAALRGRLPAGARALRGLRVGRPRPGLLGGARRPRLRRLLGEAVPITPEAIDALAEALARPLAELREQPASAAAGEALRDVHQLYAYHTGSRLRALRIARRRLSARWPPARCALRERASGRAGARVARWRPAGAGLSRRRRAARAGRRDGPG